MLSYIIKFSIKNKFIVLLFTSFIIGFGLYSLTQIPIGAVPLMMIWAPICLDNLLPKKSSRLRRKFQRGLALQKWAQLLRDWVRSINILLMSNLLSKENTAQKNYVQYKIGLLSDNSLGSPESLK